MREEKLLIRILRDLANLVAEEATKNTEFSNKLDSILQAVPRRPKKETSHKVAIIEPLPDIFSEAQTRSPEDFEHWLAELEIPVLKALIRKHDLDSSKRTQKWREAEKFAKLISEKIRSRMQRGAAFMSSTQNA